MNNKRRLHWVSLIVLAVLGLGIAGACAQGTNTAARAATSTTSDTSPGANPPTSSTNANKAPADAAAPPPQSTEPTGTPTVQTESAPAPLKTEPVATSNEPGTLVRWYGHAFVYLINSTGVRVAIDPFARNSVKYSFPVRLPADTVLISCEADDHAAGELLFGTPQIFRSYTAVGINKANGHIFKGVSVNRDNRLGPNSNKCTAFTLSFDGVTFAHLGVIGNVLDSRQRQELGRADVLFLPVGSPMLFESDLARIISDLQAKVIVPIAYKTERTAHMNLRSLDDFLRGQKLPVRRLDKSEFLINAALLPSQPTIYIPANP